MNKEIRVSITTGTVITVLLVLAGAYALWIIRGLALLVLTAVVLASAAEPGVQFFRKYKFPRVLAVLLVYLLVFGFFFGFIYYMFPPLLTETSAILVPLSTGLVGRAFKSYDSKTDFSLGMLRKGSGPRILSLIRCAKRIASSASLIAPITTISLKTRSQ